MSDHLPECKTAPNVLRSICICPELRACEQRVREEQEVMGLVAIEALQNSTLRAARDAVAAKFLSLPFTEYQVGYCAGLRESIGIIDALRGESDA